jgi:hypothetical protein
MSETEEIEFDAEERAAIVAELQRQRAEPPPAERRQTWGCLTVLVAGILLLLIPQLSKRTGWPPPWLGDILLWLLVIALGAGFFTSMVLVSGKYARASRRAREALDWLAGHPGARDAQARRHAVALIDNVFVDESGGTSTTIDIDEARKQLGANLQYVVAVERALSADNGAGIFGPR